MARNKYLPNGTTYTLEVPHEVNEFRPGIGWEVTDYPVGTVVSVVGRHRRRDSGFEGNVEYKVQTGDCKIFHIPASVVHRQLNFPNPT